MPYSLQLYTLRDALQQDLPGTIKRVADIGYTQVEPYNFVATADELGAALAENGITAPSGHAALLVEDQDEIFAAAKRLGIKTVIHPYLPPELWQDAQSIDATAASLNEAAQKGAEYGIRVGYHNHAWELETVIEGVTALEYLTRSLEPKVVLEIDTYWAAVGGQDPAALVARLGGRVKFIHIKDGPITMDTAAQLPAGSGAMPIKDILVSATALEVGVVEFDDYAGDPFDGISKSLAFLQSPEILT